MHKIITLETRMYSQSAEDGGCGRCQTSCQSACKTSCGVANQSCEASRDVMQTSARVSSKSKNA